jgi:tRNA (cmo5U34)-methyltransferase
MPQPAVQIDDQHRFLVMAEEYDHMAPLLVPMYGWLQEEMLRVLDIESWPGGHLVDLGAGSGIFLEKALRRNPNLQAVWVDASPAFLAVAQRRLEALSDRVTFVLSPLEEPWEEQIAEPICAITSMSAIHHLESAEKRALYQRVFEVLAPAGWFLNCDEMSTVRTEAYLNSLRVWVTHVDGAGEKLTAAQRPEYERWQAHFARWKSRNIEHFGAPKKKGDDLHESFLEQLKWLQEIGFTGADVFVKYHLWSVIGGRR